MTMKRKHPMKVLETAMKKHDTVLRRLGNGSRIVKKCRYCGSENILVSKDHADYCMDCRKVQ